MKYQFLGILLMHLLSASIVLAVDEESAEAAFTKIYKEAIWGRNEEGESTSGGGS